MAIIHNTTPYYVSADAYVYIAFLDGKYLQEKEQVFASCAKALQFPNYFGHNLDALEEMLNDLEWIKQTHILFIIQRSTLLLQHDIEFKDKLIQLLIDIDNPQLEIIFR